MNPLERKLRLRKTTVRDLNPEVASRAQGGIKFGTLSMIPTCSIVFCPASDDGQGCTAPSGACPSAGNTTCPQCPTYIDCPTDDPENPSCFTEPHVGCCPR